MGGVQDAGTIKASKKFTGGGGWAEIKYSVCPHPFMRPKYVNTV